MHIFSFLTHIPSLLFVSLIQSSDWAARPAPSLLDPLKNFQFFSCNRVIFTDCKFLVSLAILKTFCLCIIYLLILSLVPISFILGQTQFILQCLFKKTFHILAKKQAFAKWNSCMEFFQNHVFQSEVQPKNYPGSHISCHAFQSRWQAAESTVCQTPTSILPRAWVFKDVLSTLLAT